jgi:hypothetical protein
VNRAALLLLLMLAGCKPDTSAVKFSGEQRHGNGLIAPQPEGFAMRETDSGFALEQMASLRNPLEMKLELKRDNLSLNRLVSHSGKAVLAAQCMCCRKCVMSANVFWF